MLLLLKNHLNHLKDSIMMENLILEEEKITKDIRNLLRLKKKQITLQLQIKNVFRLKKDTKAIKDAQNI